MDRYTNVLPGLRALARTVPGMVLAYAALTGLVIALFDVLILALAADSRWLEYFLVIEGVLAAASVGIMMSLLIRRDISRGRQAPCGLQGKPAPGERLIRFGQETSLTVRMGRVEPVYLPPVGAGGALMKETVRVGI